MLDTPERATAATLLWTAERLRSPIAPLRAAFPRVDIDDAYEIQRRNIARRVAAGSAICGHKVGLSSTVMQQMMGVDQPGYGHLMTDMLFDDGDTVNLSGLCHPRIEVEVAFVLGDDLPGEGCTERDVLDATECIVGSIELIDSRIRDWSIGIIDTVADNASAARVVLGAHRCSPRELDVADIDVVLYSGYSWREVTVTRGTTGSVLGNPLTAVAWLADTAARSGVRLQAGHTILSGSCTRAVDVAAGDRYRAEFAGMGAVSVEFC